MACSPEIWSLKDLSDALNNKHKDGKKIAVPMFQRGARWDAGRERALIDSLKRDFPVGTMLFYSTTENNQTTYILVDGLQRSNSIRKYITRPTDFFLDSTISDALCSGLLDILKVESSDDNVARTRKVLSDFVRSQTSYANLQYFEPAMALIAAFGSAASDPALVRAIINPLQHYFEERQRQYNKIAQTTVPVIVYSGDSKNLPEIFDRINSKGVPLDRYEVYSAAWPSETRLTVANTKVVDAVLRKYDSMAAGEFEIYGYNPNLIRSGKKLSAFEYVFGLSKYLCQEFDILRFHSNLSDDEVNPLGYELIDACLNDTNHIPELYKKILERKDINRFEQALIEAVRFVDKAVSPITRFKGNNRAKNKIFHSKFQIMSMISTTFKEMFVGGDYAKPRPEWESVKDAIAVNLVHYYVYDILNNFWGEGGTGKIYSIAKPNRYAAPISPRAWAITLNGYFESTLEKSESKKVSNPGSCEYVFLTCIYLHTFTAIDQLSASKFDIEHLAPKDQLKKLISACNGSGLPIGSVANLCYLPEFDNRTKGAKTIYQDEKYKKIVDLAEVEAKYSFTKAEDLEWLDMPFEGEEEFLDLRRWYEDFLRTRFSVLKSKFCESLGIEIDESSDGEELHCTPIKERPKSKERKPSKRSEIVLSAIDRYQKALPELGLKRLSEYWCEDGVGRKYCFLQSKPYERKDGKVYWYAYRPEVFTDVEDSSDINVCYVFADDLRVVTVPRKFLLEHLEEMPKSEHEDGTAHWHIKLKMFNSDGKVKLMVGPQKSHNFVEMVNVV